MSDLKGNPHYRNLEEGYSTSNPDYAATTHAEALLAVAYELRTANLIERERMLEKFHGWNPNRSRQDEILKRLGDADE